MTLSVAEFGIPGWPKGLKKSRIEFSKLNPLRIFILKPFRLRNMQVGKKDPRTWKSGITTSPKGYSTYSVSCAVRKGEKPCMHVTPCTKWAKGKTKFPSNIVEIRIATQYRHTCDAMRPENDTNEIVSLISPIIRLNGSIATCSDNSSCVSLNISTNLCKSCNNSNKTDKVGLM